MHRITAVLLIAAGLAFGGCGDGGDRAGTDDTPPPPPLEPTEPPPAESAPVPPPPASEPGAPIEAHPWGGFGVGSFARLRTTVVRGSAKPTVTDNLNTLTALTPEAATVETRVTVSGTTQTTTFDVEFAERLPADWLPPVKGRETITVPAGTFDCSWTEIETETGGTRTVIRSWKCESVPGFLVKTVITASGRDTTATTVELIEYAAK